MYKYIIVIIIVILVALAGLGIPTIPFYNSMASGIPGCSAIELRSAQSFFKYDKPINLASWGRCYWD